MHAAIESAMKLREQVNAAPEDENRVHGGDDAADWTFSYKPDEEELVIAIRPDDFEERTAEQIANEVSGHFGRTTPALEEHEAGAFVEYVGTLNWTPS